MTSQAERPFPGTLYFATWAIKVPNNFGSGTSHLWAIGDDDGTFAILRALPADVEFIDTVLSSSRRGAGTPIVVAYNPTEVRVHG